MEDREYKKFEEALAVSKFAPKADEAMQSLADVVENMEVKYKQLGDDMAVLKKLVTEQASMMLGLIRITSK